MITEKHIGQKVLVNKLWCPNCNKWIPSGFEWNDYNAIVKGVVDDGVVVQIGEVLWHFKQFEVSL